ncbi:MAG: hypothetical protein Q9167_004254 [Letrouitia subvulpina]
MVRIKHRYLLVNILYPEQHSREGRSTGLPKLNRNVPDLVNFHRPTPNDITPQLLIRAIKDHVSLMYGDYGIGMITDLEWAHGMIVKYFSPATSTAIVRCSRNHYRMVWAALTYMTHLPKSSKQATLHPCVMQVVRVSGTIRKAEEEAIRRAKEMVLMAKQEIQDGVSSGLDAVFGLEPRQPLETASSLVRSAENSSNEDLEESDMDEEE